MPARLSILLLLLVTGGCSPSRPAITSSPQPASSAVAHESGNGAQLWAANCSRCHNIRSPQSFSDVQWEAIAHHMRLRANLSGQEARDIVEFLQASNQ